MRGGHQEDVSHPHGARLQGGALPQLHHELAPGGRRGFRDDHDQQDPEGVQQDDDPRAAQQDAVRV